MTNLDPYYQLVFNTIDFLEVSDYEQIIDLPNANLLIRHLLYEETAPSYNTNYNLQWRIRNQKDNPLFKHVYETYGVENTLKILYVCYRSLPPMLLGQERFHIDMFLNPIKAGDIIITGAFILHRIHNITPSGKIRLLLKDGYSAKYRYLNKFSIRKYNNASTQFA